MVQYSNTNYYVTRDARVINITTGIELKQYKNNKGYKMVKLHGKHYYVHIMVAETYVPNPMGYGTVNHKDTDKGNNHDTNLEWMTLGDNIRHSYDNGRRVVYDRNRLRSLSNDANRRRMIPVEKVDCSGNVIAEYDCASHAAIAAGVCKQSIRDTCTGKQKTCMGYVYRFKRQ